MSPINRNRISDDIAISNTGPLVSAFQCGRLDLLKTYFLTIYVTTSEISELSNLGWDDGINKAFSNDDVIVIESLTQSEQAARVVANGLGLQYIGFPGILGRAGQDGLLTKNEIRKLLKTCQSQGTHYSDSLIESMAQKGR